MASFVNLPVELKEAIIAETSFRDLASLSKTCKTIHRVALPALFRTIAFTWDIQFPDGPPIFALLRSVLASPVLAEHVKRVELSTRGYQGFTSTSGDNDILLPFHTHRIVENDRQLFEKALESCTWMQEGEVKDAATREGNLLAGIAVLLSQCTRLRSLSQDIELLLHNEWFPAMLKNTFSLAPDSTGEDSRFDMLVSVAITCGVPGQEHKYRKDVKVLRDTFLILFYLPNITTLDLALLPDRKADWDAETRTFLNTSWPLPRPPRATQLTTLRIRRSPAPPDTLNFLLEATPNLTELKYDCLLPSSQTPFGCTILRQALDRIRPTLKYLSIRYQVFANEALEVENLVDVCTGSLGSLCDYHALTTLETSLAVLYGQVQEVNLPLIAELLPPHLQRVIINDDLWGFSSFIWDGLGVMEVLRKFLTGQRKVSASWDDRLERWEVTWTDDGEPGWKEATPELKEVVLDMKRRGWSFYDFWDEPAHRVDLQEACQNQGLECEILY